jgi:hypothetical protein
MVDEVKKPKPHVFWQSSPHNKTCPIKIIILEQLNIKTDGSFICN